MQTLLNKDIYNQFDDALKERAKRGHFAEITLLELIKLRLRNIKNWKYFKCNSRFYSRGDYLH